MRLRRVDRTLLILTLLLAGFGFVIFISASLGLLTRTGARFEMVALKQLVFGLLLGFAACAFFARFEYRNLRRYSLYLFVFAFVLTLLARVPGIGFEHGGAWRWLSVGPFTFQPSELLRLAYVIYLAAWLSRARERIEHPREGLIPFLVVTGLCGLAILIQPDTDTFGVLFLAGISMFVVAGARFRDFALIVVIGLVAASLVFATRPYIRERVMVFVNPDRADSLRESYQITQSLIAVGSGGILGKGFGQSVQKFNYLPEPIGDSIFAVAAEEFGFLGASFLILLFIALGMRGLRIASRAQDSFGGLLALGIVILILSQSFINIASMLGLFPLSGTPLIFVSQGGSALLIALAEVGILLNISRYQKT